MFLKYIFGIFLKKILKILPNQSKLAELINFILIILIGSNHSRRLRSLDKKLKNINSDNFESINFKFFNPINEFKQIYAFIGDSHAEFYGRNFITKNDNEKFFITYHTGATLLLTFGTSINLLKKIFNFIKLLKNFNLKKNCTLNVIFSFGEIDVRNIYYQYIKLDKSFKDEKNLKNFIEENFFDNFLVLQKMIKKNKIKKVRFFFKDITPTTYKKGYRPKNNKDLDKIRKTNAFPVIGSIKQRVYWRKLLSKRIKIMCKKHDLKFISLKKENFNKNGTINKFNTFDGFHISNLNLLNDVQRKIQ